jgi:hypothetical protein
VRHGSAQACDLTGLSNDGPQCFTSKYLWAWGITPKNGSSDDYHNTVIAASIIGKKLSPIIGTNPQAAFRNAIGPYAIDIGGGNGPSQGCETEQGTTSCQVSQNIQTLIHEMGHAFDTHYETVVGGGHTASDYLPPSWLKSTAGFQCNWYPCLEHPFSDSNLAPVLNPQIEQFADMFLNWVLDKNPAYPQNGFNNLQAGTDWSQWMNSTSTYYTGVGMPVFLKSMGY